MAAVKLDLQADIGPKIQGKSGELDTSNLEGPHRFLGLYFSAHWCPPCRQFTPILSEFYKKYATKNPSKFDIVFVSSDRNEAEFNLYYEDMPWLCLPFSERQRKADLCKKFGVRGIPTLIIFNSESGEIVCSKAREKVNGDPEGKTFPWAD